LMRMVRLLLWSILPLALFGLLFASAQAIVGIVNEESASESTGFNLALLFAPILFLVLVGVRVWINMAEIELVASGDRVTRRALFDRARKLTFGNFGKLYTIQLVTALAVVAITLLGLAIWIKFVPPAAVGMAFIVSEATLWLLLACRLWQKASLVVWYEQWLSLQPKPTEEQAAVQIEPIEQFADRPVTVTAAPEVASSMAPPSDGETSGPA
ncbi:MAG TPA: hypothetical protein VG759_15030, partial [Candidatus Angelobacter sp.]|nr:hypothetical protein [Candidatus Angelobacter sp.]